MSDTQAQPSSNAGQQAQSNQGQQGGNDQQFHRNVAYKFRIGELLMGKPVFDVEMNRFSNLDLNGKKVVRVNVIGNVVDKYESEGDSVFMVFTLDDGSGQIKMRVFADDVARFKNFVQGQTVVVIGMLRSYNNEVYITPEIMKEMDPRYLLVRKLELEKKRNEEGVVASTGVAGASGGEQGAIGATPEVKAVKDKILDKIKGAEAEGGIDTDKIILELKEATPEIINIEVKKLLEEGVIFEPRPGRLRWLG